jgi:hypothetical protein
MGPVVVAGEPIGRHVTHFLRAVEDVEVEHLGEVGFVESLDIGMLSGFAMLEVLQGAPLALRLIGQCVGDELQAVVQVNRRRRSAHFGPFIQGSDDASSGHAWCRSQCAGPPGLIHR